MAQVEERDPVLGAKRADAMRRERDATRQMMRLWYMGQNPEGYQAAFDLALTRARSRDELADARFFGAIEGMMFAAREQERGLLYGREQSITVT